MSWKNDDERFAAELLEGAQRKSPAITEVDLAPIKESARRVWRDRYGTPHRFRRSIWLIPAAAALAGAAVLLLWDRTPVSISEPAAPLAFVERSTGGTTVTPGRQIAEGSLLETGPSRVALRFAGGQSLRLDAGTRARLTSPRAVDLYQGAIYLDSSETGQSLSIRTAAGDFTPVGTQFEVRIIGERSTHLRVREGRVRLDRRGPTVTAGAGEEWIIRQDGSVDRNRIAPDHPAWDWVVDAAPLPAIEGRTLRSFLDWMCREKGWKLQFATPEADAASRSFTLHGSIEQMTAADALRTVMLSSGLEYRVADGTLLVR